MDVWDVRNPIWLRLSTQGSKVHREYTSYAPFSRWQCFPSDASWLPVDGSNVAKQRIEQVPNTDS